MSSSESTRRSEQLAGVTIDNKYRVVERIGAGGGGIVYRAEQVQIERFVAIKVLHSELVADEQALMRFRDEAKLACKITHPNAVCIYDYGVFEGLPYLVMELVSGKTLRELIRSEKTIAPGRSLSLMATICETLAEAHSLGIVHRDLKPDNIMVCPKSDGSEWIEVLDFGVASMWRSLEGADSSQWSFVGTPQYVAPEQLEKGDSDARADIYSIGVLLYEMLTGVNPFNGQTVMECLYKHMNHVPGSLRREHPHLKITQQLDDLIERCLEKDPSKRFQSTVELLAAVRECEAAYDSSRGRRWYFVVGGVAVAVFGAYAIIVSSGAERESKSIVTDSGNTASVSSQMLSQNILSQTPLSQELSRAKELSKSGVDGSHAQSSESQVSSLSGNESASEQSNALASSSAVPVRGMVTVESRGRVAMVLINGEQYGETPLRNVTLAPGEYELLLRCSGCEDYSERIEIEAGVTVKRVVDIALLQSSSEAIAVVSSSESSSASNGSSADSRSSASDKGGDSFLSIVKRAEERYRRGLYAEAIPLFEAALEKKDNVRARLSLGNCYVRLSRFADAEVHFKAALQQAPYHAPVHYNLACLYALKGQREEAIRSIMRTVELDGLSRYSLRDEADLKSVIDDPRVRRVLR